MNRKFQQLLKDWPLPLIRDCDVESVFPQEAAKRLSLIKRAIQNKKLIRLKRGCYALGETNPYNLANGLYPPSYVSFESALSFYGLIPERIYSVISASNKRNKNYETPLGSYMYRYIPPTNFYLAVHQDPEGFLIASPYKALADLYYFRRPKWINLKDAMFDLRIMDDELFDHDQENLEQIRLYYPSLRVRKFFQN